MNECASEADPLALIPARRLPDVNLGFAPDAKFVGHRPRRISSRAVSQASTSVSKFVANSGSCAPTAYVSLQVVSPSRSAYSTGLVYASRNGDSLFPAPIALDANGRADISVTHVDGNGPLPQFLIVLAGSGGSPASVDVKLSWTGVANAQRIVLTLSGVSDGANMNNVNIPMSLLLGDLNASGGVNSTDISLAKAKTTLIVS